MNNPIYFDYAAATPVDNRVLLTMQPYFDIKFYNPSAIYLAGREVAKDIESARSQVAKQLGSRPAEIIFTAGGTEANNLAINGVMQAFPGSNIVVSTIEHDSVLEPAKKFDHKSLSVLTNGVVDVSKIQDFIDEKTVLVSVMYANNEIGTVQPISEIAQVIKTIRHKRTQASANPLPLYLHTDAAQAGNYLPLFVSKLGVDLMTLNGGKIYGPKQSGALYIKSGTKFEAQITGGGQEFNKRSGTENVPGIIGFATALQLAGTLRESELVRMRELREYFIEKLTKISNVELTVSHKKVLPNNLHLRITGQDNERLMMAMDEQGILCAIGSACSASSDEPSHVLKAIGFSDKEARESLRFTMGRMTSTADIDYAVSSLTKILAH